VNSDWTNGQSFAGVWGRLRSVYMYARLNHMSQSYINLTPVFILSYNSPSGQLQFDVAGFSCRFTFYSVSHSLCARRLMSHKSG
jgi:hypothetical protein